MVNAAREEARDRRRNAMCRIAATTLAILIATSCDAWIRAKGQVFVAPEGQRESYAEAIRDRRFEGSGERVPIEGATITLQSFVGSGTSATGPDGAFSVEARVLAGWGEIGDV